MPLQTKMSIRSIVMMVAFLTNQNDSRNFEMSTHPIVIVQCRAIDVGRQFWYNAAIPFPGAFQNLKVKSKSEITI
jgi:hypothetical protein